jgi:hypothetical protein
MAEPQPSKLAMRVRFPSPALDGEPAVGRSHRERLERSRRVEPETVEAALAIAAVPAADMLDGWRASCGRG